MSEAKTSAPLNLYVDPIPRQELATPPQATLQHVYGLEMTVPRSPEAAQTGNVFAYLDFKTT
jgi:hypothetical protein